MRQSALLTVPTALVLLCSNALAQPGGQRLQASSRAATALCIANSCRMTDTSTLDVLIEYGVPHARSREIFGTLVPDGQEWRLGANTATHMVTKHAIDLAGTRIPAGKYTLYLMPDADRAHLIVSDTTGQWGIPYPGAQKDRARVLMRSRTLAENVESLTIALVPNAGNTNAGVLNIRWGRREFSVPWTLIIGSGGNDSGLPRPER